MNTASDNKDLNIANNEYVAFDALSLRSFITSRLNNSGIITDQNYEGSNITAINNIIAYAFHVLLYYQNQTATESLFSEAQLYENMNRIVKQLNYAPIGVQTSTLSFSVSAGAGLTTGYYTIPRYTLIRAGNATYSFNEDITFTKVLSDATEELTSVGNQYLLYQGNYIEYPLYTARGESNEIVYLIPGANVTIDHFNIDVYIKKTNSTGKWTKWNKTESLYLQNATDTSYEIRLNSNKNYEIKFGDNINGANDVRLLPAVYIDKYQEACVCELMNAMCWKYNDNKDLWYKDGYKTEDGIWVKYNQHPIKYAYNNPLYKK